MTFREKYVAEYLEFCSRFDRLLTVWEQEFIRSVRGRDANTLTARQFNKLRDISERITNEVA